MMEAMEAGAFGDVAIGTSEWRVSILRGLNILTCHLCQPPMMVPDWVRLVAALVCFGGGVAAVSEFADSAVLCTTYCVISIARLLTKSSSLLLVSIAAACVCAIMTVYLGGRLCIHLLTICMVLSEICWVRTLDRILDYAFDFFTSVLWAFLGIMFTYGLYPLAMKLAESKAVQKQLEKVAKDTASAVTKGDTALSQLVPLALLLIGVPSIAGIILVYCYLFDRMPRLFKGLALMFASFIGGYAGLLLMGIELSQDFLLKAVFSVAWVAVYYAFAQMEFLDWQAAEFGPRLVAGAYLIVFCSDFALPGRLHPKLLFIFVICCKLAYALAANALDSGETIRLGHLVPLRRTRIRRSATISEVVEGSTGGNPSVTATSVQALASTGGDMEAAEDYSRVSDDAEPTLQYPSLSLVALQASILAIPQRLVALPRQFMRTHGDTGEGARELMMPSEARHGVEFASESNSANCT